MDQNMILRCSLIFMSGCRFPLHCTTFRSLCQLPLWKRVHGVGNSDILSYVGQVRSGCDAGLSDNPQWLNFSFAQAQMSCSRKPLSLSQQPLSSTDQPERSSMSDQSSSPASNSSWSLLNGSTQPIISFCLV